MSDTHLPMVLIVDDSATTRAMIKRIVGMADPAIARMCEAANGAEGLKVLNESHVDLVFADLNMPVMDGFEMIAAMRADPKLAPIPVVVISAQPDQEQVDRLKRHGVAAYLPKPFTAEHVHRIVVPLLEKSADREEATNELGEPLNLSLAEALTQALETMAFISPEPVEDAAVPAMPADSRLVRVHFKGRDAEGSLALVASPGLGAAMASNIDVPELMAADDALKELANITCGLMLRMRPGGGIGFQLDPPQLFSYGNASSKAVFKTGDAITLAADGEMITAQVVADSAFSGM
ncbi:MAG: cheY [Phycisphaerales bacterium]|nr:cheY [Phycisphaerales bacterium]